MLGYKINVFLTVQLGINYANDIVEYRISSIRSHNYSFLAQQMWDIYLRATTVLLGPVSSLVST